MPTLAIRRPGLLCVGDTVRTPEPIGAIPAGTVGTVIEVRRAAYVDGKWTELADYRLHRYTVRWHVTPTRWTSELAAPTLEVNFQ